MLDVKQSVKFAQVWNEQDGKYGAPLGWQIFGVEADNAVLTAHLHTWKIDFASNSKEFSVINRSAQTQNSNGGAENVDTLWRWRLA